MTHYASTRIDDPNVITEIDGPATVSRRVVSHARVAALDGIRGLAIVVVMIHHALQYAVTVPNTRWAAALASVGKEGWIGVDLFFALSGYLITGILLRQRGRRHYFRDFYTRRTLRIFPLYYGFVFLMCVVLPHLHPVGHWRMLSQHQLWYWLYVPNYRLFLDGNWSNTPLDHAWSLAIEEQFYLVWPAIVYLLGARRLAIATAIITVCSIVLSLWMSLHGFSAAQIRVFPFSNCHALALGALVASLQYLRIAPARIASLALASALLGVAVRLGAGFVHGEDSALSHSLVGTGWTFAFSGLLAWLVATENQGRIAKLFSGRVLTFFGTYSYGLYLVHRPLMMWFGSYLPHVRFIAANTILTWSAEIVVCGGISTVLAYFSYNFFEMYFLRLKKRFE